MRDRTCTRGGASVRTCGFLLVLQPARELREQVPHVAVRAAEHGGDLALRELVEVVVDGDRRERVGQLREQLAGDGGGLGAGAGVVRAEQLLALLDEARTATLVADAVQALVR